MQAWFSKQNVASHFLTCKINIIENYSQYYEHVEEAEWAVESCKATGKPTAVSLCIGPQGDLHGIPTGECAVRLANAGIAMIPE